MKYLITGMITSQKIKMINFNKSHMAKKPQNAAEFLNKIFENNEDIDLICNFFIDSIERAKEIDSAKVSVNYRTDKQIIRLNVGRLEVLSLSNKGLLVVMHYQALNSKFRNLLDSNWQYNEDRPTAYKVLRGSCRMRFQPDQIRKYYQTLREANDHIISLAVLTGNNPWMKSNNDETISTLYSYQNNSSEILSNPKKNSGSINKRTLDIKDLINRVSNEKKIQYDFQEIENLKNLMQRLSDIEYDIINIRYSVDSEASGTQITLQDLGNKYNLTRERIRQIEKDAINKLSILYRHDISINSDIPFNLLKFKTQKFLIKHKFEKVEDLLKSSIQILNYDLKIDKKLLKDIEDMLSLFGFKLPDQDQDMINFDKLSVRLKNVLIRNNLKTVDSLLNYPAEEFEYLTNLGEKTLEELYTYRKELAAARNIQLSQTNSSPEESGSEVGNIDVQINTNDNLEAEISLKFSEEIAEDLIMGDVETISLLIKKLEENLYEI